MGEGRKDKRGGEERRISREEREGGTRGQKEGGRERKDERGREIVRDMVRETGRERPIDKVHSRVD